MASQLKKPNQAQHSAALRQSNKIKNYVNQQLEKTRNQVKVVDLISGILVLVVFVIGFLLLCAVVDAWVWPLSTLARWICLAILVVGVVGYSALSIVPLFLRKINLDYVAKMVEEAKPNFQNSLLNYVSFRKRPEEIKPAVFDAVSRQAASDLASVPGEAAVDQSKLIHLGLLLVALTFAAVCYAMFSPKSPFQTAARIFSPGGKISQPAVVQVLEVKPGDATVFFGQTLEVSAHIRGSHQPEDVKLTYSSVDQQVVDQTIVMVPQENAKNWYRAELGASSGGIQQSLRYRVTARDGASPEYLATVRPNPSIAVDSVVIKPPAYTELAERTISGQGDVDAIEGSWVTVNAQANLPIEVAHIELLEEVIDPGSPEGELDTTTKYQLATSRIEMKSEDKLATGRFQATWDSSGEKPFATHYRIMFTSVDGERNSRPNIYPIRLTPDLAPEIRFRNPIKTTVEVPENGVLAIDVEASDLDFKISSIRLKIDHDGSQLLDQKLQMRSSDQYRRVNGRYLLRPSSLNLKAGDRAIFFATAADNRMSPLSASLDPNVSRTENYSLTVIKADENIKDGDRQDGGGQDDGGQDDGGQDGGGQDGGGQDGGGQDGGGQDGGGQDGGGQDGGGQDGGGQDGGGQDGGGQDGGGQDGGGQDGGGQDGGGQNEGVKQGDPTERKGSGGPTGDQSGGGDASADGPDGGRDNSLTNGNEETVSDNASDAERIRKMQKHFEEQKETRAQDGGTQDGGAQDGGAQDGSAQDGGVQDLSLIHI